jgi:hypothetical protein
MKGFRHRSWPSLMNCLGILKVRMKKLHFVLNYPAGLTECLLNARQVNSCSLKETRHPVTWLDDWYFVYLTALFLVGTLLPTHCRRRRYCCAWSHWKTRTHTHTLIHSLTHCSTPLDEWSDRRRGLHLAIHNIHKRQTSMPPAGFEPTILESERPQTQALDCVATGICWRRFYQRYCLNNIEEGDGLEWEELRQKLSWPIWRILCQQFLWGNW